MATNDNYYTQQPNTVASGGCIPTHTVFTPDPWLYPPTTSPSTAPPYTSAGMILPSTTPSKKKLIIIGGGGHGHDVYGIVKLLTDVEYVGCLDDNPETQMIDYLGPIKDFPKYLAEFGSDLYYVIGINDSKIRKQIAKRMEVFFAKPLTIIHPSAVVSNSHRIGAGSVLGPLAVVTERAELGVHVHLNTAASVNQGSKVGDFCTLSPGARICGDVTVGEQTMLGANSTIINLISVGSEVIIGAGAVVVTDIPDSVTAKGVPAKYDS